MRKFLIAAVVAATAAVFAVGPVAAASDVAWHRLNPDASNPAPEHERLDCVRGSHVLLCQYNKVRGDGYHWDRTVARFKGHDTTDSWSCPDWFDSTVCDHVTRVWSGHARYWSASSGSFEVEQEMVVVNWGGQKFMFQYWVDQFACPWFGTFAAAIAANPQLGFDCMVP